MIVHYNGDDDGDGNICGDNRQKDEPCFHVLIHLDFVSLTHTHKQRVADDDQQAWVDIQKV